jgi:hypothetical protein
MKKLYVVIALLCVIGIALPVMAEECNNPPCLNIDPEAHFWVYDHQYGDFGTSEYCSDIGPGFKTFAQESQTSLANGHTNMPEKITVMGSDYKLQTAQGEAGGTIGNTDHMHKWESVEEAFVSNKTDALCPEFNWDMQNAGDTTLISANTPNKLKSSNEIKQDYSLVNHGADPRFAINDMRLGIVDVSDANRLQYSETFGSIIGDNLPATQ